MTLGTVRSAAGAFGARALGRVALPSRADVVAVAQRYADHRWTPTRANVMHRRDADSAQVETPDESHHAKGWLPGVEQTGMAYQWRGFSTPAEFDAGVARGAPAGDVNRAAGSSSRRAVGIDCSGLVARAWGLPQHETTESLVDKSVKLSSYADLQPGDIVNKAGRHTFLFVGWADDKKRNMNVIEAGAVKVHRSLIGVRWATENGYEPRRDERRAPDAP